MAAVPHLPPSFLLSLFLFLPLFLSTSSAADLSQSDALLTLKKSLDNPPKLRSWDNSSPPCVENERSTWAGIVCFHGSVTGIHLSHMGLSGSIDIDALATLPTLRTISLIDNKFGGYMPDFNRLGPLKALYLTGNRFSGEIPDDYFSKMASLKKVWLAGNEFRGPIPTSLSKLPHLIELHLEGNHFSGMIPDFKGTPLLRSFDVSRNRLQGSIPESLGKFDGKAFQGNPNLCGVQVEKECPEAMAASVAMNSGEQKQGSRSVALVITMMILLVGMLGILIVVALKKREDDFDMLGRDVDEDAVMVQMESSNRKDPSVRKESHHSRRGTVGVADLMMVNEDRGVFGLPDLMKAAAEVLGTGGLGSAYKAVMASGVAVVVKRMREMNRVGNEGFDTEMRRLGALRHLNVLPPLAYHFRKEEKLLVYEFVPKGSLLYLLHGDRGPGHAELDWPARLKIVRGIARGMGFLHSELPSSELPHGNLKSSNILLGPDFEPLLADFGFFPLVQPTEASNTMFAYKSPECLQYRHLSPKSDVYCLGIVILEILTGKFPSQYLNHGKGGTDVVQWVVTAIAEKRVSEVLDPEISGNYSSENARAGMEWLLRIGAQCAEPNVESRPDMKEATDKIEKVASEWESSNGATAGDQQLLIRPSPSLRDGYGDMPETAPDPAAQSHAANVREGYGEVAGQRTGRENFGDRPSLRRNGESFAFDIS